MNVAYEVIEVVAYVKQDGSDANWELTAGQIDSTDHYLYWNTAGTKLVAWTDTDGGGTGDEWVAFDINASAASLAAIGMLDDPSTIAGKQDLILLILLRTLSSFLFRLAITIQEQALKFQLHSEAKVTYTGNQ